MSRYQTVKKIGETSNPTGKPAQAQSYRFLWLVTLALCGIFAFQTFWAMQTISMQAGSLEDTPITIVLDAGHGGEDGGAVTKDGVQEKNLNLEIAQKLRPLLESSGLRVVMIRNQDISVGDQELDTVKERKISDLHRRLEISEGESNSILLSIHQNHFSEPQYSGTQIFYSPNLPDSQILAQAIQDSVVGKLQPNNHRECKEAGNSIYLMWNSTRPAVLVECGFLSNSSESKLLQSPDYQKQMAFSIWSGLMEYLQEKKEQEESFVMLPYER